MFWPFNPNESDKLKAAAADFSSLTLEQKHMWVAAAMCVGQTYRLRYVKVARRTKKKNLLEGEYTWASYLNIKELVMMGDMDHEEAKNVYKKTKFVGRPIYSFEDRLRKKDNEQYWKRQDRKYASSDEDKYAYYGEDKYASSYYYYDEDKYDEEIDKNKKACSEEKRCLLDPKERENMLANVESYRIKMEQAMSRIRKKTESDAGACSETKFDQSDDEGACSETKVNQSDEAACSETKFNQSDEAEREEILADAERYQKKTTQEKNRMMKEIQFNLMKQLSEYQNQKKMARKMKNN